MRNRSVIRRDERGATLVIVAAFMVVAVLMVAAVVDLGGLRAEKKEVTLSTDAAALAAVASIDYADPDAVGNGTPCASVQSIDAAYPTVEDVADRYLTENGHSVLGTCQIFFGSAGSNQAYLTVTASDEVDFAFDGATGQASGSASGVTSARAGSASIDGILPIGVCGPDSPGVQDFVRPDLPFPQYFGGSETVTLDFENSNCGGSGNHDQIDFLDDYSAGECGDDIEGAFCSDIHNRGYRGTIPAVITSNPGGGGWNGQDLATPLTDLRDRKVHLFVPVVGNCAEVPEPDRNCSGSGAKYPVDYIMEVVIESFVANGTGAGFTFDVYQVVDYAYYEGNGLPTTTPNLQVKAHICATGPDVSGCTNNPPLATPPPPPPPPPPCAVDTVVTAPASPVSVTTAGELVADLVVDVTVDDVNYCDTPTVALNAVGPTTVSAPAPPSVVGNTYTFTYSAGTAFSPFTGSVFDLEFSERGVTRDSGSSITIHAPNCAVTDVQPITQSVAVDGTSTKQTNGAVDWEISMSSPELCGDITGAIVNGEDSEELTGPTAAASTMTFVLADNTPIPNGKQNKAWSVRFFDDGVLISSSATLSVGGTL